MCKELSDMSMEELWELFPVILEEHTTEWDDWYQEEQMLLAHILNDIPGIQISHIGSTAIKGILAKPTVDILIEAANRSEMKLIKTRLKENGYLCMSEHEKRMIFNKGYTKYGFAKQVFHIHIRLLGDHDELYFRDYMNEHEDAAKEYEQLKRFLWKQYEHNRDAYTNAKTEFVKKYTELAKHIYDERYE